MRVGDMVRFKPDYLDLYDPADHSKVDMLGIVVSVMSGGRHTIGPGSPLLLFSVLVTGGTVDVFEYEVEVVS